MKSEEINRRNPVLEENEKEMLISKGADIANSLRYLSLDDKVDVLNNQLLIKGAVPGARNGTLIISK